MRLVPLVQMIFIINNGEASNSQAWMRGLQRVTAIGFPVCGANVSALAGWMFRHGAALGARTCAIRPHLLRARRGANVLPQPRNAPLCGSR